MIPEQSDTVELFVQLRAGQAEARDRIMEHALPPLLKFARRRLPPWARGSVDTQDLVQDVMVKMLPRLGTFQPAGPGALQGFLRRAVWNQLIDEIRKRRRRPMPVELTDSLCDDSPSPLEEAIRRERHDHYREALATLSDGDRTLIVQRLDHQRSYEEIAALLGKPTANACRVAIGRALARLAKAMATIKQRPRSAA